MARVIGLLDEVAQEDFWRRERFVQIVRMIDGMEAHKVKQNDIAFVLNVFKSLVSRCKSIIASTRSNVRRGPVRKA